MIIKIILFLVFLSISIFLLLYKFYNNSDNIHKVYGKIANTDMEKIKGLMYRKEKLKYNEGMLFPMEYKNNSMWMKNTYIPLDVIFLDDNMRILGYVLDTVPLSLSSISINKKSNNILEMNGGSVNDFNMKIGDKILFIESELS
ncbi:DUF192 domain-containing protein [bacterium]|jgi:uncharacterized membrane protein (UPF0127 family)|nr:DUF192 domain-containing protein [bacterium]|tara:strand:- start:224 stop:655 length:432 start_codon:yes stop_codon:yes gene_type:complete